MFYLNNRDLTLLFASDITRGTPEWLIQLYEEYEWIDLNCVAELPGEMDVLFPKCGYRIWLN